jgi:hypothetical protein
MMKNDTFESLVPGPKCSGPKCSGPKSIGPKYISGPKYSPGRSCFGPKYFRAEVFRAEVSVGPKLSLGQTGCEPFFSLGKISMSKCIIDQSILE